MSKEDKAWKEVQHQWGTHRFALSRSPIRLGVVVNATIAKADSMDVSVLTEAMTTLQDEVNEQVAVSLTHALRMARDVFNDISSKRRECLIKGVWDNQLSRWLEDAPETLTSLFSDVVAEAMEAARARCTDGLLSLATKAVGGSSTTRFSSHSSSASTRGRRFEWYSSC